MNRELKLILITLAVLAFLGCESKSERQAREYQEEEQRAYARKSGEAKAAEEQRAVQEAREAEIARQEEIKREEEQRESDRQSSKANELAEYYKDKIIKANYNGGVNTSVTVNSFDYYSSDQSYKIKISLYWSGQFSGDSYAADGFLSCGEDGSNPNWNVTWKNSNLESYLENKQFWIGAAAITGALLQSQK